MAPDRQGKMKESFSTSYSIGDEGHLDPTVAGGPSTSPLIEQLHFQIGSIHEDHYVVSNNTNA